MSNKTDTRNSSTLQQTAIGATIAAALLFIPPSYPNSSTGPIASRNKIQKNSGSAPLASDVDKAKFDRLNSFALRATSSASTQGGGGLFITPPSAHILSQEEASTYNRVRAYLDDVVRMGVVTPATAELAWQAWQDLTSAFPNALPIPNAGVGPDDKILFSWNRELERFEIEVFSDGHGEFFYIDHETDAMWGDEYTIGAPVPEEAVRRLAPFVYG